MRVLFFVAPSLILLLFDTLVPTLAVQMKTQGAAALPTRTGGLRVSKSRSKPPWYSVIGLSLFNVCLGVAIQAGVELFFTAVLNIRSALKVTTTLPMPWSIAKDVARGLILREVKPLYLYYKSVESVPSQSQLTSYRSSSTTRTVFSSIIARRTSLAPSTTTSSTPSPRPMPSPPITTTPCPI